jgi:hypothetical protein
VVDSEFCWNGGFVTTHIQQDVDGQGVSCHPLNKENGNFITEKYSTVCLLLRVRRRFNTIAVGCDSTAVHTRFAGLL